MTAKWRLLLLFAGVRGAFFRSVACPLCLLELKIRVPKLAQGTEACLPGDDVGPESRGGIAQFAKSRPRSAATLDSGSDAPMSAQVIRCVCTVLFVVLQLLGVLNEVVRFAAAVDDSGWWPSELAPHRYWVTPHLKGCPGYRVGQTGGHQEQGCYLPYWCCDGHRRADQVVRLADSRTTICRHACYL